MDLDWRLGTILTWFKSEVMRAFIHCCRRLVGLGKYGKPVCIRRVYWGELLPV